MTLSRRTLLASVCLAVLRVPAVAANPGDQIRKLVIVSAAQASDPQEFQAAQLLAQAWRQLGLDIEVKGMPRPQLSDLVWNTRDKWDMTMWRMVGRPERSDPDEFAYNLFNPATAATGYDFVGYDNPNYMKIAEAQRSELDQGKRKQLIYEAQDAINKDQPYIFLVYPKNVLAYDKSVWKQSTVVEQSGIGIRSFWTYLRAEPLSAQKDMITNAAEAMLALNPLYISGAIDSWLTEIIWDRLMRVGPDGLPIPWAAEKVIQVDPNTVDCVLRPGQKWHDGNPMTVDDVVFSFKAPTMGDKSPMYKPFVANIADVMATDDKTVRFKLKTPSAAFAASTLAKINLIPKHVWEPIMADLMTKPQNVETYQEQHPVGSGPFKVARFKFTEEIVLEANKDYWKHPSPSASSCASSPILAPRSACCPRGRSTSSPIIAATRNSSPTSPSRTPISRSSRPSTWASVSWRRTSAARPSTIPPSAAPSPPQRTASSWRRRPGTASRCRRIRSSRPR